MDSNFFEIEVLTELDEPVLPSYDEAGQATKVKAVDIITLEALTSIQSRQIWDAATDFHHFYNEIVQKIVRQSESIGKPMKSINKNRDSSYSVNSFYKNIKFSNLLKKRGSNVGGTRSSRMFSGLRPLNKSCPDDKNFPSFRDSHMNLSLCQGGNRNNHGDRDRDYNGEYDHDYKSDESGHDYEDIDEGQISQNIRPKSQSNFTSTTCGIQSTINNVKNDEENLNRPKILPKKTPLFKKLSIGTGNKNAYGNKGPNLSTDSLQATNIMPKIKYVCADQKLLQSQQDHMMKSGEWRSNDFRNENVSGRNSKNNAENSRLTDPDSLAFPKTTGSATKQIFKKKLSITRSGSLKTTESSKIVVKQRLSTTGPDHNSHSKVVRTKSARTKIVSMDSEKIKGKLPSIKKYSLLVENQHAQEVHTVKIRNSMESKRKNYHGRSSLVSAILGGGNKTKQKSSTTVIYDEKNEFVSNITSSFSPTPPRKEPQEQVSKHDSPNQEDGNESPVPPDDYGPEDLLKDQTSLTNISTTKNVTALNDKTDNQSNLTKTNLDDFLIKTDDPVGPGSKLTSCNDLTRVQTTNSLDFGEVPGIMSTFIDINELEYRAQESMKRKSKKEETALKDDHRDGFDQGSEKDTRQSDSIREINHQTVKPITSFDPICPIPLERKKSAIDSPFLANLKKDNEEFHLSTSRKTSRAGSYRLGNDHTLITTSPIDPFRRSHTTLSNQQVFRQPSRNISNKIFRNSSKSNNNMPMLEYSGRNSSKNQKAKKEPMKYKISPEKTLEENISDEEQKLINNLVNSEIKRDQETENRRKIASKNSLKYKDKLPFINQVVLGQNQQPMSRTQTQESETFCSSMVVENKSLDGRKILEGFFAKEAVKSPAPDISQDEIIDIESENINHQNQSHTLPKRTRKISLQKETSVHSKLSARASSINSINSRSGRVSRYRSLDADERNSIYSLKNQESGREEYQARRRSGYFNSQSKSNDRLSQSIESDLASMTKKEKIEKLKSYRQRTKIPGSMEIAHSPENEMNSTVSRSSRGASANRLSAKIKGSIKIPKSKNLAIRNKNFTSDDVGKDAMLTSMRRYKD